MEYSVELSVDGVVMCAGDRSADGSLYAVEPSEMAWVCAGPYFAAVQHVRTDVGFVE